MLIRTDGISVDPDADLGERTLPEARPGSAYSRAGADPVRRGVLGGRIKRATDIVLAAAGIVLLLPLMLAVALVVKMTSPGPVLYGHARVGLGGRTFRCWKFRSMVMDGNAVLQAHIAANPEARAEWEANLKLRDDPRVTPIGHVLRAYSLDELPQLFNVLAGDMSLVGPRPVVRDELSRYGRHTGIYLCTRPGITGLWQVSGRSDVSYDERVGLDRAYVEGWSLLRDMVILVKTIPAALFARGSY